MRARSHGLSRIVGQAADVGALAADDIHHHIRQIERNDAEGMDSDLARFELDRLSGAGFLVGGHPIHLQGGIDRWHLIDQTGESLIQNLRERRFRDMVEGGGLIDRSLRIVTRGGRPETDLRPIRLFLGLEAIDEFRRFPDTHDQDTIRHGIQCAGMADFPDVEQFPHHADHTEAAPAQGFVHDEERTGQIGVPSAGPGLPSEHRKRIRAHSLWRSASILRKRDSILLTYSAVSSM